jgi:hypothetical protein
MRTDPGMAIKALDVSDHATVGGVNVFQHNQRAIILAVGHEFVSDERKLKPELEKELRQRVGDEVIEAMQRQGERSR